MAATERKSESDYFTFGIELCAHMLDIEQPSGVEVLKLLSGIANGDTTITGTDAEIRQKLDLQFPDLPQHMKDILREGELLKHANHKIIAKRVLETSLDQGPGGKP
jgi:hypothetical protein